MKRIYLPKYGSKRYNELKKLCNKPAFWCIHCGRILLHPLSIMNHIGGTCQAKQAEIQQRINESRELSESKQK